jgi:sulfur carrier protein
MLAIELNGEVREVRAEDCIQDLIDALSLTNQALAIAVNRQVVPRVQWRERRFAVGDKVDIVKAIGGG